MKSPVLPAMLALVAILALPVMGQLPVIPAKTPEQTRFPVFQDGSTTCEPANFRLHLDYTSSSASSLALGRDFELPLPAGNHLLELTCRQAGATSPSINAWIDDKPACTNKAIAIGDGGPNYQGTGALPATDRDFTVMVSFQTTGDGPLFAKCAATGPWSTGAKALFVKDGKLIYDAFGVGAVRGRLPVDDGKPHHAELRCKDGLIELVQDGKLIGTPVPLSSKDDPSHVFKAGLGADNFTGELVAGNITNLRFWARALTDAEFGDLGKGRTDAINTPDINWSPPETRETFGGMGLPGTAVKTTLKSGAGFKIREAWIQPLEAANHARLISGWNRKTLAEGQRIYQTLCIVCHGTPEKDGSLPTARKFHLEPMKNGSDPYRMYQTIDKGYGMMMPQPQLDAAQKYAVIQYIRETYFKPLNKSQHFDINDSYLAGLPKGLELPVQPGKSKADAEKPYENMDFGPSLSWTFQVNRGARGNDRNIAQKGIVIRLDEGDGGVSEGKAWMLYEQDTMRVATAYTGSFVDWRGIAFDGSHGTHTSITGDPLFINPDSPAWENPVKGGWTDERLTGRDERRYGPLPREWLRYLGRYRHGAKTILHYQVGKADILELPGLLAGTQPAGFTRTLNIGKSPHDLETRVAPEQTGLAVVLKAPQGITLTHRDGAIFLHIPAASTPARLTLGFAKSDEDSLRKLLLDPIALEDLTHGGPAQYPQVVTTTGTTGKDDAPFALDNITIPNKSDNPWNSWMRVGGFDFYQNNPDRAALCTWYGDVWLVDGVAGDLKELKWRRICTGLYQALGLKIVDNTIYVTCRDQIARLHDLNGDDEIDYVECFNTDHQVTENFHEFAMGLQADHKGNFYYAKSARHGLPALVPHHGTLLRVSPDGSKTTIVANGFRAANGVCINEDDSCIVTDQEGNWTPKNRINYVKEGGFYGNMWGYSDVTDSSDSAMEQPLVWITNAFDRSPAELLWVPKDAAWGPLNGTLLNMSYGYGQVYTVPHEFVGGQAQGGMCALPLERTPTGLMRGRFHPSNKQLYVAGLTAWATNCTADGGFYRIRATGKPSYMPVATEARKGTYTVTFSDPLPASGTFKVKVWNLKRTSNYGSSHYDEHELRISMSTINGNKLTLEIPELAPTQGMEISCEFEGGIKRILHASIHHLP